MSDYSDYYVYLHVRDSDGIVFYVLKYGEEQAKHLAIEFRQEYEKTRNFSERHGK